MKSGNSLAVFKISFWTSYLRSKNLKIQCTCTLKALTLEDRKMKSKKPVFFTKSLTVNCKVWKV